jgi:hypothetical protein
MIRRVAVVAATVLLTFISASSAPPASATVNPHPTDWRVVTTFLGRNGEDVPLRVGRRDAGPFKGFGVVHIEEAHGRIPSHGYIEQALTEGKCRFSLGRTECTVKVNPYQLVFVAFTERVDPTCPDGRPVGVITAYYIDICPCRDQFST